jgi:hypothetical protein
VAWLTSLPAWALVVGSVGFALLVAAGSRVAVRAIVPADERSQVQSIAAPLMAALAATFAILTGLTLASEAGYLRSAQDIVSEEASSASRLAWAATIPGVRTEPIQSALGDYLRATRADEWHGASAAEADDPSTAAALKALERAVRTEAARTELGTPASTELLAALDQVSTGRRARIAAESRELPVLYVLTLVVSGVAVIANAGALTFGASKRTSTLIVGLACVVGLTLALLFALSAPWRGPLTASGRPIDTTVRDLDSGFFSR